jgi:serine protease Do
LALPGSALRIPALDRAANQATLLVVLECAMQAGRRVPALTNVDAVTLISVLKLPRGRPARWLLACALLAAAGLAGAQPSTRPAMPLPVRVNAQDLPAAFSKPAPASLADLREMQDHVAALVSRVSPAVVEVEVGNASGSGVVISEDGWVLTAGHVGEWAGRGVKFTFPDGRTARGRTVGVSENSDTGLMRITNSGRWPHVNVGEMNHAQLGDWTLALGHPGGFDLNRSLVARLGRIVRLMPGVVQTDCTIFPGDSGGPLFDMYGRVIAIHTAITDSTVENFHVPINEFFDTWNELTAPPPPPRPLAYCGLGVSDDAAGCLLSKIEKNSPAAKADLKLGDHLLTVNGRRIEVAAMFKHWMADSGPGETLQLEIKRGQKVLHVPIKLQTQPRGTK